MYDYTQPNQTLRRLQRHKSFVNLWNGSICYYPEDLRPNSSEMCLLVKDNPSCGYFVYYIDYLHLMFCTLKLEWDSSYVIVLAVIFLLFCGGLYMIIKYFCLPNYLALMDMLPISRFTHAYIFFGFCLYLPDMLSHMLTCPYPSPYGATLVLSRMIGDVIRCFVSGIMVLSVHGQHVENVVWWTSMSFIWLGFMFVYWTLHKKYELFGVRDLPYSNTHMLTLSGWACVSVFALMLLVASLVSYQKQRWKNRKSRVDDISVESDLPSLPSDLDVERNEPIRSDLKRCKIWWNTVNGYTTMKEHYKIVVIAFIPFYFILANIIPVIDNQRPMRGWCKAVVCISFMLYPFLFIGPMADPTICITLFILSWLMALLICMAAHSLREPAHVWLCLYAIQGMTVCAITMHLLIAEINNLVFQYLTIRFQSTPDMLTLMFFSTGELVAAFVLLHNLIELELYDAACGGVISMVTFGVYTILPELVLNQCYTQKTFIAFPAAAETGYTFFSVIFFGTLFHVSMSGNEFRMSLFFYLVAMTTAFILFQLADFFDWVHPFGTIHIIKPPKDSGRYWA